MVEWWEELGVCMEQSRSVRESFPRGNRLRGSAESSVDGFTG